LLIAINRSDFHSSSNLIQEFLSEGITGELASFLHTTLGEKLDLRIRDHVSHYLSIEPGCCALEIPSYDLLDIGKEAGDRYEAATQMFQYVSNLVDSKNRAFNSDAIRIEKAAPSAYSVLLPKILQRRVQEINDCKVPFASSSNQDFGKTKYYVGNLLKTTYGKSIFHTFPRSDVQSVVGETMWNQIASILQDLGFSPDSMYEEVPDSDWYLHVKSLDGKEPKTAATLINMKPTDEIEAIRHLAIIIAGMQNSLKSVPSLFFFETIKGLRTRHYNKELIELLPNLSSKPQEIIFEILVNTRDPASEDLLNDFLKSKHSWQRIIAARGFARLNALESLISVNDPKEADSIDISELLASTRSVKARQPGISSDLTSLAMCPSPMVKKDLVKILVELYDVETKKILFQLLSDPNDEVGIEVLSQIDKMPPNLAREILRAAIDNPSKRVISIAEDLISDGHRS
jgi:hypothetical protein